MTVYAETVFLENFIIDAALLSAVDRTLHAQTARKRKLLGALLGALFAAITPVISLPPLPFFALKLAVGVGISKCGVQTRGKKRFALSYLLFLCYTFLLGGTVIGAAHVAFGRAILPYDPFSALFLSACYLLFYALKAALLSARKINALSSFYYQVSFFCEGKKHVCRAYFDSGNHLQAREQIPLFVAGKSLFSRLLTLQAIANLRTFPALTAAGETALPMLPITQVEIRQGKTVRYLDKAYVLAGKTELFPVTGCELLLGTETFLLSRLGAKGDCYATQITP
jgi:stage II sporulation protein GA (sporulation sigma-E factor processing peptidase)